MQETIFAPIRARYRILNGEAVKQSSECVDVSADAIAELLILGFGGLPILMDEINQTSNSSPDVAQAFPG